MLERCPWELSNEYLGWFAVECHYTPNQVYEIPWVALVKLTLLADDITEERKREREKAEQRSRTTIL